MSTFAHNPVIVVAVCLSLFGCARRQAAPELKSPPTKAPSAPPPQQQKPVFSDDGQEFANNVAGYSFHYPQGTKVHPDRGGDFDLFHDDEDVLSARMELMDGYYGSRAKELDSVDLLKGFALARASDECAKDTPEGTFHYDLDTLITLTNPFGIRVLEIHLIFHDNPGDTQLVYFVDLSHHDIFRGLMIPRNCGDLDVPEKLATAKAIVQTIRQQQ